MPQEKAASGATIAQELKELREQAKGVAHRDIHLGQVLDGIIVHLARLHGVSLDKKEEK